MKGVFFMQYLYPVIFTEIEDGSFVALAPDVPGCVTGGKDLKQAVKMIKDALNACLCVLEDEGEIPNSPTAPRDIVLEEDEFITLIEADTTKYRAETDNRSVRRNVSLPAWLNFKAEQANINCSQILQKALKQELQIAE